MGYLSFVYRGDSRELKKNIGILLRSGLASDIKKFNYVHGYRLNGKNIEKKEEKIILILSENHEKLLDSLKTFSQNFERIDIK